MAWYAELKRRHWYCINEWDAISWYSKYIYETWYKSLTPEQKTKLAENEQRKQEKRDADAKKSLARLGILMGTILGEAYNSRNRDKYHGIYDENGNINHKFFENDRHQTKK